MTEVQVANLTPGVYRLCRGGETFLVVVGILRYGGMWYARPDSVAELSSNVGRSDWHTIEQATPVSIDVSTLQEPKTIRMSAYPAAKIPEGTKTLLDHKCDLVEDPRTGELRRVQVQHWIVTTLLPEKVELFDPDTVVKTI